MFFTRLFVVGVEPYVGIAVLYGVGVLARIYFRITRKTVVVRRFGVAIHTFRRVGIGRSFKLHFVCFVRLLEFENKVYIVYFILFFGIGYLKGYYNLTGK